MQVQISVARQSGSTPLPPPSLFPSSPLSLWKLNYRWSGRDDACTRRKDRGRRLDRTDMQCSQDKYVLQGIPTDVQTTELRKKNPANFREYHEVFL